jgi:tetrahydromethanopterin S-methyltransferase subunit G
MKQDAPIDEVYKRLSDLEEKYSGALEDIKRLEEENIETTNCIYEIMNSIDAVDNRIDIIVGETTLNLENYKPNK